MLCNSYIKDMVTPTKVVIQNNYANIQKPSVDNFFKFYSLLRCLMLQIEYTFKFTDCQGTQ